MSQFYVHTTQPIFATHVHITYRQVKQVRIFSSQLISSVWVSVSLIFRVRQLRNDTAITSFNYSCHMETNSQYMVSESYPYLYLHVIDDLL